jgi:hypothetical protein
MLSRILVVAVASFVLGGPAAGTVSAGDTDKSKMTRLMNDKSRAKGILLFLHFGATYVDHNLTDSGNVTLNGKILPGHFFLAYTFDWKVGQDGGATTIQFFFDDNGALTTVKVARTNAILNQPFALANVGIKALGEVIKGSDGFKNMSATEQRLIGDLIDTANAKGLLELILALDLAASK